MKIKKLLIAVSCLSLTGCGGGDTPTPTPTPTSQDYYVTIDAPKDNTYFSFARKYTIDENQFYISKYSAEYLEDANKYKVKITDETELDLIVSCDAGYDISNPVYTLDGINVEDKISYSPAAKYHVFEFKDLASHQKNMNISFNYDVVEAKYDINIGEFIAPTKNTELYNNLMCKVEINDVPLEYNGSKEIKATELKDALLTKAKDNKINISFKEGIKFSFYFKDKDYFFCDKINMSELYANQGFSISTEADYVDLMSEYTLHPKRESTLSLDFSKLDTAEYKNYSIVSYLGNKEVTSNEVLVNGVKYTEPLTNKVIQEANSVVINYTKDALGVSDLAKYNLGSSYIAGKKFTTETNGSRIRATADTLSVIIKDTSSSQTATPVYWYTSYLEAATDGRHNSIIRIPCKYVISITSQG